MPTSDSPKKRRPSETRYNQVRRRRRILLRRSLLAAAVLAAALLVWLGAGQAAKNRFERPYDTQTRYASLFGTDSEGGKLELCATELCAVDTDTQVWDEDFKPDTGLVCHLDGGYSLFDKNAFERMNPASTTKIMTALLALKYGDLDDTVTVTDDCVITEPGASLAGIQPGEQYTLEALLYGLLLPSGNDAANAIAVHLAGSLPDFNDMMNREAQALGAVDTHFNNAHGITDEDHYTSAYDLYLMLREAMSLDGFEKISSARAYTADYMEPDGTWSTRTWKNGNRYLNGTQEPPEGVTVLAGKTGTTMAAGNCLALCSRDADENRYICVILKAANRDSLYANMNRLLEKTVE